MAQWWTLLVLVALVPSGSWAQDCTAKQDETVPEPEAELRAIMENATMYPLKAYFIEELNDQSFRYSCYSLNAAFEMSYYDSDEKTYKTLTVDKVEYKEGSVYLFYNDVDAWVGGHTDSSNKISLSLFSVHREFILMTTCSPGSFFTPNAERKSLWSKMGVDTQHYDADCLAEALDYEFDVENVYIKGACESSPA